MGVRTKTFITVILVGTVVGVFALQSKNKELFKGQIFTDKTENTDSTSIDENLSDLTPTLEIINPSDKNGDINVKVTIGNIGATLSGNEKFNYELEINGTSVLENSDSYSTLESGDSFSFNYPIPKAIYAYPNQGKIKFTVDSGNVIKESNEDNNEVTMDYNY